MIMMMTMMHCLPLEEHDPLYDHPNYHHHHNFHLHNTSSSSLPSLSSSCYQMKKSSSLPSLSSSCYQMKKLSSDRQGQGKCSTYSTYRQRKTSYFCTYYSSSSPRLTVVVQTTTTTTTSSSKSNISTYHHHHMDIIVIDRVLPTDDHISLDHLQLKGIHTSLLRGDLSYFEIIVAIIR